MRQFTLLIAIFLASVAAFAQPKTEAELKTEANLIRNNSTAGGITKIQMADMIDDLNYGKLAIRDAYTVSGTDTYTVTVNKQVTAYALGQKFPFIFTNANTGAATLNLTPSGLSALGAKAIKQQDGDALSAGDIPAGAPVWIMYDGTSFRLMSGSGSGGGGGSGTVTTVSVTTTNGVSGSVANATTTPAITLTLGAITPSSVNSVVLSGSSTPTLAVTGTTTLSGAHSGTSSGTNTGDQTTVTGNAGTATALATARAIYGNSFDGTGALTQIIAPTYGGTGNGFTKFSGPAATEKTFTLPNANATIARTDAGQTFTGTQTFTPTSTVAGLNIGQLAGDPSGAGNGDLWYNSTAHQLIGKFEGSNVAIYPQSGGSISGLTTNRIPYATSSTTIGDSQDLKWDNTNKQLVIGHGADTIHLWTTFNTSNVYLGYQIANTSVQSTADDNVFIGGIVGSSLTTGNSNVGIGPDVLQFLTNGNYNVGIGFNTLRAVVGSSGNVAIGRDAGTLTTGASNTAVGYQAGNIQTTGDGNTFFGVSAGNNITTATGTLALGNSANPPSATANNGMSIKNSIYGTALAGTGTTVSTGNLGIFIKAPTARMHVIAGTATAGTAPFKIDAGTVLGTTEAGAIENDGTHLYYTAANAGTRFQLDQQSGGGWSTSGATTITGNTSQSGAFTNTGSFNGELITQNALSASHIPALKITPGTHTAIATTTENINQDFAAVTQTWASGTTATQRFTYFRSPTINSTSGTATFTNAFNVFIDPPIAGTTAAFTNGPYALGLGGTLKLSAGSTSIVPIQFISGSLKTSPIAGSLEFNNDTFYGTLTTGPTRQIFTMNNGGGTAGRIPFYTSANTFNDVSSFGFTTTAGFIINSSQTVKMSGKTTTYTTVATDYIINCTGGGTFTVTLLAGTVAGQTMIVKNSGAGVITVATTSSQTIDGASTATLAAVGLPSIRLTYDGTSNWVAW